MDEGTLWISKFHKTDISITTGTVRRTELRVETDPEHRASTSSSTSSSLTSTDYNGTAFIGILELTMKGGGGQYPYPTWVW